MFSKFQKHANSFLFIILLIGLISFKLHRSCPRLSDVNVESVHMHQPLLQIDETANNNMYLINQIIVQRNKMSKHINMISKKIGQTECEIKGKMRNRSVNSKGGYCNRNIHYTDAIFAKALSDFMTNKTVASFGDGPGAYKKELLKLGKVQSFDSFDGGPFSEEESNGEVMFMDLTVPQYGLNIYYWVMCVEVAEHIPKLYEQIFLDNLVRHAREGIILSWSTPGQAGISHVNNQPLTYVVGEMKRRGFKIMWNESNIIQKRCSFENLRKNVHIYRRNNTDSNSYINLNFLA